MEPGAGVEQAGARASKAGIAVVKRRAGSGRETPRLIVMTERVWSRLSGAGDSELSGPEVLAQEGEFPGLARPAVARPTPAMVRETLRALKQASAIVRKPGLVRALRQQTGCSQAGAYRAVTNAFAAGVIG